MTYSTLPARRKKTRRKAHPTRTAWAMGNGRTKAGPYRNGKHLAWIRSKPCLVQDGLCGGSIEAAHVRLGTDGGMSLKPSDYWTIPLCSYHHKQQHSIGEETFKKRYDLHTAAEALSYWMRSPYREEGVK